MVTVATVAAVTVVASCSGFGPALVLERTGGGQRGRAGLVASDACRVPGRGDDFERVSPADVDVDVEAVRRTVQQQTNPFTASFRIYRDGCLIGRTADDDASFDRPVHLFSMTKSIVALVVGRAVALGRLSVDDPIGRFVPEADAAHASITVRQLLTHTSGLRFAWLNDLAGSTEDSVGQALSLPRVAPGGSDFEYAQTTVTLLAYVVERAVGEDFQAFASRELFEPVGIAADSWSWWRDAVGHTHGYAWLQMAPVDVARLATLVLHRGEWDGRSLIGADYIADMGASTPTNPGYGYLVQTNQGDWHIGTFGDVAKDRPVLPSAPRDTVLFTGFLEQGAFVVPSLGLVIVRVGLPWSPSWRADIFTSLLPGIPGAVPAVPGPPPPPDPIDWDWDQIADLGVLMERLAVVSGGER